MVRRLALALALVLSCATLLGQSPAPQPSPAGGQQNPASVGANAPSTAILAPQQTGQGKRRFQYPFPAPSNGGAPGVFVVPSPVAPGCPVSLRAQQRTSGGMISTGNGRSGGIAQRIRLIVDAAGQSGEIVAATVTVRGTNGKWRVLTASQYPLQPQGGSPYASTTLAVSFRADADRTEAADLELPGFTSVTSIRLDALTYADGTTWTPANSQACRVAPDPFVLVGSR